MKQRNSALELLRIIAMFLVVLSHSTVHGGFGELEASDISINGFILKIFQLGKIGVNLFMLISGYFLSNKKIEYKRTFPLFSQVWVYSLFCLVIGLIFNYNFSFSSLSKVFLPTIFSEYWFFTAYIILYLYLPYLNSFINKLSRNEYLKLLAISFVVWSLIPTLRRVSPLGSELINVVIYYFVGAFFSKYPDNLFKKSSVRKLCFVLSILGFVFIEAFVVLGPIDSYRLNTFASYLFYSDSIAAFVVSVSVFAMFAYMKLFTNKFINVVSSCTFGVYLIHDNPIIRELLWHSWMDNTKYYNSPYLVWVLLGSSIIVFVICTIIEFIRQKTIAKPLNRILNKTFELIEPKLKSLGQQICNKV